MNSQGFPNSPTVVPFPVRLSLRANVPSLPVMVRLLMHEEVWAKLDRFQVAIVRRAYVLALFDSANPEKVVEYMRYCWAILSRHYVAAPIDFERVA